jgi:dipeptidyl aminopeptidase/acylaminoacyl peptidase
MSSPRRIRIEDLVTLRQPGELAVSPTGEAIAFALTEPDLERSELRTQIHRVPAPSEAKRAADGAGRGLQLTRGLDDAHDPQWSPDGRSLALITFRPQPHEDEDEDHRDNGDPKRQVFLLPAHGGEARRLTQAPEGVELFRWCPDGTGVVTLGIAPSPAAERGWHRRRREGRDDPTVVHGEIPELELVLHPLEGSPRRLLGGARGIDDFDLSPDGRLLAYATNRTGRPEHIDRAEIVLLDLETGEERQVSGGRGGSEWEPRFTADGRFLLFGAWSNPQRSFSRHELFAVDLTDPQAPPRGLLGAVDRDLETFVALPDGRVAAIVAWGFEARLLVVAPDDPRPEILPLHGRQLWSLAAPRREGRLGVVTADSAHPPEVAFVDPSTGALEIATRLNPEVDGLRRARRRRVEWENEGFRHEGLLVLPEPAGASPPPVLVWLHGGPHWRGVDHFELYDAEAFAADGWAVFVPQYRGSSGYPAPYAEAIREDLGGADARDVLTGLDLVVREGLVDGERAAVAGASYGGYLANWLLATTDRFRAGISIAGIFDLAQDFGTSEHSSWELHYLGGAPWDRPELYRERSPLTHAASLHAPVLILHGMEDDNTYLTNSKALYRALVALERSVEFVAYPREGHGIFEPTHRVDAHRRMVEWLARHVTAAPAAYVPGRWTKGDGLRLAVLGHKTHRELGGVAALEGRMFLELSLLLRVDEGGPERLVLVPAGPGAEIVLTDEAGDRYRPLGVSLDVHGQHALLFVGDGQIEGWQDPEGRPASVPVAVVFELREEPATLRLQVKSLPPVLLEVNPAADEDEEAPRERARPERR